MPTVLIVDDYASVRSAIRAGLERYSGFSVCGEAVDGADAIEKAIRAKHRVLHMKPNPPTTHGWYNPPSILRLLRYENPIKMSGDPDWDEGHDRDGNRWEQRERTVYETMMQAKRA